MSRRLKFSLVFALFGLLLGGCASANRSTIDGDTLRRNDLHLSATKPAGWRFLTPEEKRKARTAVDYKHTGIKYHTAQNPFPPRIVIAKYPEPRAEFNPSVSIDLYPLGHLIQNDPLRAAGWVLRGYQQTLFTPLAVTERLQMRTLGGKKAAYFRVRYSLEVRNGEPHEIDEEVWAVTRGTSAYLVFAPVAQTGPDANYAERKAILESLRFDE